MAIPEEIRKVERPRNTVVTDNGKDGVHRYAVRERAGTKYVPGGNPQPRNGKVIGYIYNGAYVPKEGPVSEAKPDMLSYGASALVKSVSEDLFNELLQVYEVKDACTIMAIATLKIIKPGICLSRIQTHYNRTFVRVDYPGLSLSKNTLGKFVQALGQDGEKRRKFYEKRIEAVSEEHHVAIDGTLKQNTSKVNDLSAFSYKARVKGCKDVSVLYAYDIEEEEPVCSETFPGNSIDSKSYKAFIRDNDIRRGIILTDKGFPPSEISDELSERPELHFLTPIKRNDTRIKNNDMLSFEGVLKGVAERILYKKKAIKGGRFLYSFMDAGKAAIEEACFISRAKKNENFDGEKYSEKKDLFGVIVFESDQNLPPETVYKCYDSRWQLEMVFRYYKSDECLDKTGVQGDFSVIGMEFINFISTVATCRIKRKAGKAGLLDKMSYGDLLDDLSSAWRTTDAPAKPKSDDGYWVHTLVGVFEELEKLGLSEPAAKPEPKKPGRKPKPKVEKPKRPRGRPRKNTLPS